MTGRHCWLRLKRHRLSKPISFSMIGRGFALSGGELRRCDQCGWLTTSGTGGPR